MIGPRRIRLTAVATALVAVVLAAAAARGAASGIEVAFTSGAAVTIVLASEHYPAEGDRGGVITGTDEAEAT